MNEKIGRRKFLGRGLRVSAGAALTKAVGSTGTSKVVDYVALCKRIILTEWGRYRGISSVITTEWLSLIDEFIASVQRHMPIETFMKLRGLAYMGMEYDMWVDDPVEYVAELSKLLGHYTQFIQ